MAGPASPPRIIARPVRSGLLAVMAILVVACGSATSSPPGAASPPASTPTAAGSATTIASSPASPSAAPSVSAAPSPSVLVAPSPAIAFDPTTTKIQLEKVVGGLNSPLAAVNAGDGSERLFVVEQPGRVKIIRDGQVVDPPFLDIRGRIASGGERGLLGIAFAPGFPADPRVFVDYTDLNGDTVVSSFSVPPGTPDQADPGTERILLRIDQPFPNHNGGALAFGPDDDLYVATGDGGSGGDPMGNGQNLDTLLGKLLRIRPAAADATGPPYTIPSDAPFASRTGARPEVFAYGLRNPWRFSFDRATGDLWIGDVGQGAWEEVDHWPAGSGFAGGPDFGWNIMEGRHCYDATTCRQDGLVLPVAEYGHDQGCAIVGGYVSRDPAEPTLWGGYLFGDSCTGRIWGLDASASAPKPAVLLDSGRSISSFGQDEAGRLYLTDLGSGELYRIVAANE
jgi:glucose/arabinose dehydrogenase